MDTNNMIQIEELQKNELVEISGGKSVVYWIMYVEGQLYAFADGVIDGLFG
jgi:hypothetical protein